jgi:EmrB/QacA subfamily drug resistance transporter
MFGAVVFGVASIVAARTDTGSALIAARALQGVGGAMMSPTSLSLLNATYTGRSRTVAFAIYGSLIGGMAAVGPLLGGWLTEYHSWRWAFYINVPIAVLIVVGSLLFVPESSDETDRPGVDIVGAVLSALGIGLLVFGLIEGRNYGWWTAIGDERVLGVDYATGGPSPVPVALAVSVVSLVLLYVVETRRERRGVVVLLDFDLFRIRTFGFGSLAATIVSLGEFGILFSLPLFLQSVQGFQALGAGAVLASLALGAFLAAPTAARIAFATNPRFVARLGLALEIVGIVGLGATITETVSAWVVSAWLIVYGAGVGYASAQLTGLILVDVPVEKGGQASGTQSTARQVGSALGTAILGTILFVSLSAGTESNLQEAGVPPAQAEQLAEAVQSSAGMIIPTLEQKPDGAVLAEAAGSAYASAIRLTAFAAAGFVFVGLLATLALPPGVREEDVAEAEERVETSSD